MAAHTVSPGALHGSDTHVEATRYLVPVGRVLFSLIFLYTLLGHFSDAGSGYAAQQGVPMAGVLVPLSGVMAIVGGLSVALGFYARWGAALLVLFLLPVTFLMHPFWNVTDPAMAQMQQVSFLKNLGLLGFALFMIHFGAGPLSLDERRLVRR